MGKNKALSLMLIHAAFDLLAMVCSFALTLGVYFWRLQSDEPLAIEAHGSGYIAALIGGAVIGGYGFGTLNLMFSDIHMVGRSIVGALAGAIAAIEIFKRVKGISGSTGLAFVPAFATSVMIGRLGCYFAGLEDQTFGVASDFFTAQDFGDGVLRHPVQLYESASMAVFLLGALWAFWRRQAFFMNNGFYLLVLWYAGQRFAWEFLKPYGTIAGPFNLFHFVCAGLIIYACFMMMKAKNNERI